MIHPLERLIQRENVARILAALTPAELVVALLRGHGWTDEEIAETLGIGRAAVRRSMREAQRRIEATLPRDVACLVRGRQIGSAPECDPRRPDADLSISQVAQRLGASLTTVHRWCRAGAFPGATRAADGYRSWRIPSADLDGFQRPKRRCTATTVRGRRCRQNAVPGSDPPHCARHAAEAPDGGR